MVFTLLMEPLLLQAPYRDIAKATAVALGTVGTILTDLRGQGKMKLETGVAEMFCRLEDGLLEIRVFKQRHKT